MIEEIQKLIDNYLNWLKDRTSLKEINDVVEITTPFLDRHNDYIQIYVKKYQDGFLLTDDGYTIEDLYQSGCDLTSQKRLSILNTTLNGYGVKKEEVNLTIHARSNDFSLKKHNLIQAILAVNDLFFMASPVVSSLFIEDVAEWLDASDIRYTPKVKFTGKSGYDHLFDFVIPKSRKSPERILKAINKPNRDAAESFAFSWIDTKDVRTPETMAYVVLNDSESSPSSEVFGAFQSYSINPILWSERKSAIEILQS